jgi:hypothetical protein
LLYYLSWVAADDVVWFGILGNHSIATNYRTISNSDYGQDGGGITNPYVGTDSHGTFPVRVSSSVKGVGHPLMDVAEGERSDPISVVARMEVNGDIVSDRAERTYGDLYFISVTMHDLNVLLSIGVLAGLYHAVLF